MAPKSSNSERRPSPSPIPDLTNKITRPEDQYCEAGGFGDVFRCRYTSDDGIKEVAVKAFRFSFSVDDSEHKRNGEKAGRMIRRELGIWSRLHHRNIVPFIGVAYGFGKQGSASLVSMWMPHGTLHSFLEAHEDRLVVSHRLQLLLDIASGLHYLHSFPMVHGDLSSNNVLLDHNYNACLTDFGCASLMGELPEGLTYLNMTTARPGTLRWAAPEHFSLNEEDEETKHTIKSDIYSFGNIALLVLTGKYPWSEVRADAAVVMRLSQGLKPGRPGARPIDDKHWALIERCWSSVLERPPVEDIVSSLGQLLDACATLPPLHKLLSIPTSPASVPDYVGSDNPLLHKDALEHAEVVHSYGIPPGVSTIVNTHRVEAAFPSWASTASRFLIHPLLNEDAPYFYFDLAYPIFRPGRWVGPGRVTAISRDELQELAIFPPIIRMRISHDDIPQWPIDLEFHSDGDTAPTEPPPITLGDVLLAIHTSLHRQITHQDWANLSSSEETGIAHAYDRRYKSVPSSAQVQASEGVKRVDYLLKKHVFRGLLKARDEDGFNHWSLITT